MSELADLQRRLGYQFGDECLLQRALTHPSYVNERDDKRLDNQRLEFLGDAILEAVISETLFARFPKYREGELSQLRSSLVCEAALSGLARGLDVGAELYLGKGELLSGGRDKASLLADAYEAIIAAVYLDSNYERARDFILSHHEQLISKGDFQDAKSALQEYVQEKEGETPAYRIIDERGPDHAKEFVAQVYLKRGVLG